MCFNAISINYFVFSISDTVPENFLKTIKKHEKNGLKRNLIFNFYLFE